MSKLIQEKLDAATARFDLLGQEIETLKQQIKEAQKQISVRGEERVKLMGKYEALMEMLKEKDEKKEEKKEEKKK